jgi:hypothetical protein
MRLAKDLQCLKVDSYCHASKSIPGSRLRLRGRTIKVDSYCHASKSIDDIGRQVGGWLRSRPEEVEG